MSLTVGQASGVIALAVVLGELWSTESYRNPDQDSSNLSTASDCDHPSKRHPR